MLNSRGRIVFIPSKIKISLIVSCMVVLFALKSRIRCDERLFFSLLFCQVDKRLSWP